MELQFHRQKSKVSPGLTSTSPQRKRNFDIFMLKNKLRRFKDKFLGLNFLFLTILSSIIGINKRWRSLCLMRLYLNNFFENNNATRGEKISTDRNARKQQFFRIDAMKSAIKIYALIISQKALHKRWMLEIFVGIFLFA